MAELLLNLEFNSASLDQVTEVESGRESNTEQNRTELPGEI